MARRTPDRPSAAAPPPAQHDPLFDDIEEAPPHREPGDDSDELPLKPAPLKPPPKPEPPKPQAAIVKTRSAVTGEEVEVSAQSSAVGKQIEAEIAARTLVAVQRPRSFDDARVAILRDCERPGFARAAVYSLPSRSGDGGKRIEGLSIRFVEAALGHWGNISMTSHVISDDDERRIVRVRVVDMERNVVAERDITVAKRIERSRIKPGQEVLSQRINSKGEIVYVVRATDEEVNQAEARERSRVMRNEGARLLPPDVKEEALTRCRETSRQEDAKDPDTARKKIGDAFADIGLLPSDLALYLGCELRQASPAQIADLREVYQGIRDGDVTWSDFLSARAEDTAPAEEKGEGAHASAVAALKADIRAKQESRKNGGAA